MALKHRLADASYWIYDRTRHKTAFDSAAPAEEALDHHYGRTRRIYDSLWSMSAAWST